MPFRPQIGQANLYKDNCFSSYNQKIVKKKTTEITLDERLENLPVQSENYAFKTDELTVCAKCARANPPTRPKCLYCGAPLPISEAHSKFLKSNRRKLEAWEKGFNLIYLPDSENCDEPNFEEIAALTQLEKEVLREIIEAQKSLPVARVETENEAEIIQRRLRDSGMETRILADEDLKIEKPARRLRGIDFWEDKLILILFNRDEIAEILYEDLILIVTGAIFERRVEATEARVKKGESKLLQTNETASDEILVDIYSRQDEIGYRVEQNGFDFSCLGSGKSLLAAENIRKLAEKLSACAPNVKLVEDYSQVRPFLANVWEVEERTDSQGLKRRQFGKFNLENITTISNSAQFTKYSRLQRHLL